MSVVPRRKRSKSDQVIDTVTDGAERAAETVQKAAAEGYEFGGELVSQATANRARRRVMLVVIAAGALVGVLLGRKKSGAAPDLTPPPSPTVTSPPTMNGSSPAAPDVSSPPVSPASTAEQPEITDPRPASHEEVIQPEPPSAPQDDAGDADTSSGIAPVPPKDEE